MDAVADFDDFVGVGDEAVGELGDVDEAVLVDADVDEGVSGRPLAATDPDGQFALLAAIVIGIIVGAAVSGATSATVQYATHDGHVNWGWKGVAGATLAGAVAGGVTAGFSAVGAGIWSGAIGGSAGSMTNAAVAGQSGGGIIAAGALGAVGALAAGGLSSTVNDAFMLSLEPTGISLNAAIHVSAAASSTLTGAAMGVAAEGARAFADSKYKPNYANALGTGAAYGASGYIGSAMSGQLPHSGPAFDKPEEATRYGNWENQAAANTRSASGQSIREVGSLQYEWGGKYYSSANVVSRSGGGIDEDQVRDEAWTPAGATVSGFSHAHPPPDVLARTLGSTDTSFRGFGGFHQGDKDVANDSWAHAGKPSPWVEGISTPDGHLELYYPQTGNSSEQPRLRGLPAP